MSTSGEVSRLREVYLSGEVSPVEIARSHLETIASRNAEINAFSLVDEVVAIETARASEARYRRGESLGPLDGIPVTIKDTLNVAGWPTRRGSRTTSDAPAMADAVSIARLRAAGAVLLGKTTTPEFAWKGLTQNLPDGVTSSSLDPTLHAGGSSGGAAAATGLGMGVVGIGTDAAGSVRIPAAFCGVVGFKPTFATIPLDPLPAAFWQLPHIGPIARSVRDAAVAASIMSGPASSDSLSLFQTSLERRLEQEWPMRRPRVGIPAGIDRYLEPPVQRAWDHALRVLGSTLTLAPVEIPIDESRDIVATLYRLGCLYAVSLVPEQKTAELDPAILEFVEPVRSIATDELLALQRRREEIASQAALLMTTDIDVLLTPTMPCLPPHIESAASRDVDWFRRCPFTPLYNLTRGPALSVPWPHPDAAELPIGLQIGAAPGNDGLAVAAAALIERAAGSYLGHAGADRYAK